MPKYEWYFLNKDDDVCKHVTYILAELHAPREVLRVGGAP